MILKSTETSKNMEFAHGFPEYWNKRIYACETRAEWFYLSSFALASFFCQLF